jgi:single-strand DNA-binding protein
MAASNINRVTMTGNLTRDPELRSTANRRKDANGEWTDRAHYFSVTVFGAQGENCARFLSKGRPIALDGRLEWREWQTQDGAKRESVEIVAETVQFLGSREEGSGGGGNGFTPRSDVPADASDFQPAGAVGGGGSNAAGDDDIPF